jgi:hypothetical protein
VPSQLGGAVAERDLQATQVVAAQRITPIPVGSGAVAPPVVRNMVRTALSTGRSFGHPIGVGVDGGLVEHVDHRRLGPAARGADLAGHRLK